MIFRQLYEPESSTYTYLLGCVDTRQAVLLDPVIETLERDLAALDELKKWFVYQSTEKHDELKTVCF